MILKKPKFWDNTKAEHLCVPSTLIPINIANSYLVNFLKIS